MHESVTLTWITVFDHWTESEETVVFLTGNKIWLNNGDCEVRKSGLCLQSLTCEPQTKRERSCSRLIYAWDIVWI